MEISYQAPKPAVSSSPMVYAYPQVWNGKKIALIAVVAFVGLAAIAAAATFIVMTNQHKSLGPLQHFADQGSTPLLLGGIVFCAAAFYGARRFTQQNIWMRNIMHERTPLEDFHYPAYGELNGVSFKDKGLFVILQSTAVHKGQGSILNKYIFEYVTESDFGFVNQFITERKIQIKNTYLVIAPPPPLKQKKTEEVSELG